MLHLGASIWILKTKKVRQAGLINHDYPLFFKIERTLDRQPVYFHFRQVWLHAQLPLLTREYFRAMSNQA